jgi:hypothetical protein
VRFGGAPKPERQTVVFIDYQFCPKEAELDVSQLG